MSMRVQTRGTLLDDADFARTLYHLAQYHAEDGVLSIYLNLDQSPGSPSFERALNALLEPLHSHTKEAWLQGRLEYEIAGAMDAVRSWQTVPGRAVAMFFCGPGGLETIVPLRFSVPPLARFGRRPVLSPLISALDDHRRYCAVLFERRRARIVTVMLEAVEDDIVIESDVIGAGELRRWSHDLPGASHVRESDLHAHAMRVIEHLWAIDRSRPIHGLILAGDPSAVPMLRRLLPRSLTRAEVHEAVDLDMSMNAPDIAHRVHLFEQRARENEDAALVTRLLEERTGDLTVKGWEPTLKAINEGRVQILLQTEQSARTGAFCAADHFVALDPRGACPVCGDELRPTEHLGEAAARSVLLRDGQVHALAPGAATTLQRFGAGAILRY
jgi:hypothetical protein